MKSEVRVDVVSDLIVEPSIEPNCKSRMKLVEIW